MQKFGLISQHIKLSIHNGNGRLIIASYIKIVLWEFLAPDNHRIDRGKGRKEIKMGSPGIEVLKQLAIVQAT